MARYARFFLFGESLSLSPSLSFSLARYRGAWRPSTTHGFACRVVTVVARTHLRARERTDYNGDNYVFRGHKRGGTTRGTRPAERGGACRGNSATRCDHRLPLSLFFEWPHCVTHDTAIWKLVKAPLYRGGQVGHGYPGADALLRAGL